MSRRKKILVIEDDESIQETLTLILEKAGYEIEISPNGQTIYDQGREWPDIFLLDKQLKEYDGLEICKHLKSKQETRDIPVIMLSATPGVEPLAYDAGADDFMEKPFNSSVLMAKVAQYLK
jgi:DNA-binding response OmpR family regulator